MEQSVLSRDHNRNASGDIVELVLQRALHDGDRIAYTFLEGRRGNAISYAELDQRARRIGAELQQRAQPGQYALLLYQPGLDYLCGLLGCLYAGLVAVPASPPDLSRLERALPPLQALVADARLTLALSTRWIVDMARQLTELAPEIGMLDWVATDALAEEREAAWRRPEAAPDAVALLQYTAGTTGAPRGVLLSHANMLHNLAYMASAFGVATDTVMVSWLPPYADMGLFAGMLLPLYAGFPCFVMEPTAFLRRPLSWLEVIAEQRATLSGGPNFAYDLCVRRSSAEERNALELSSWRLAFNGGEPVQAKTLTRFAEAFGTSGFRSTAFLPCYTLTEATCLAAGDTPAAEPAVSAIADMAFVGVELPSIAPEVLIVDPLTGLPLTDESVGEIWLRGPGIGQGYWNRPEETTHSFAATTADGRHSGFLRTGDLGLLRDGRLYIVDRCADRLTVAGQRIFAHQLETTVEQSHAALRPGGAVAFVLEHAGNERLIVAAEIEREAAKAVDQAGAPADLVAAIAPAAREAVAATHACALDGLLLLHPGDLPRTISGKLQRSAGREALLAGTLNVLASSLADTRPLLDIATLSAATLPDRRELLSLPRTERRVLLESGLRSLVAIHAKTPPDAIKRDEPLPGLNNDVLAAAELAGNIRAASGAPITAAHILGGANLAELADMVLAALDDEDEGEVPTEPTTNAATFPLSYGQRAMWFLQQLTPTSSVYTLTIAGSFIGKLDEAALRRSLRRLSERYPTVRTVFALEAGEPVQRVVDQSEIGLHIEDATAWSEAELEIRLAQEVFRPFDLERGPLMRITVLRRSTQQSVFLLAAHHIITDFWSLALFVYEWAVNYGAEARGERALLPPVTAPYADYVRWEQDALAGARGEELWQFWQQQLRGELPVLDLPTDRPRPQAPTYRGGTRSLRVDAKLSQAIKELARAHGATTFMAVLTAFQVLLHRYSGQDDIIVGVPRAARRHEWSRTMGYLVNPLPIRTVLAPEHSYATQLEQVRATTKAAFAHAEFPFALMVERLQLQRDMSRTPIFQVMLAWQKTVRLSGADALTQFALNQDGGRLPFGDGYFESLALRERVVPFDLTLLAGEAGDELFFSFEYNSDLFDPETVDRMLGQLVTLLTSAVADPTMPIGRLALLSEQERRRVLADAQAGLPAPQPAALVPVLFAEQAARRAEAPALCWWAAPDEAPLRMSYEELNRRADRLANYLRAGGVGPETIVGVCIERSPELIVALLAILKAGGVFLPLDPAYPPERLHFMLADAGAAVVLTQAHLTEILGYGMGQAHGLRLELQIVRIDTDWPAIVEAEAVPAAALRGEHAAYVIYTSGSTGTPKGVVIEHKALATHILTTIAHYELDEHDRVLQFASLNFDAAIEQVLETLLCGAELVLRPNELWAPEQLQRHAVEQGLSVINIPPAYWQQLVAVWAAGGVPAGRLRLVIVGGDQLQPESIALWRCSPLAGVRLLNAYGPTETTITATTYAVPQQALDEQSSPRIAIGRPLAGRSAYILDAEGAPVPAGVPGELYLGGVGVARGYLNRPELTAEYFVADPFSEQADARLYRTGDLVRMRADGNLEFLGRIDQQVKIRGFRVEPGEIESLLRRHPRLADALVLPYALDGGDMRLAAYLLAGAGEGRERVVGNADMDDATAIPSAGELRSYLRQSLPEFMLPAVFVPMKVWPLTPSGKIDRRALPLPEATADSTPGESYTAPRNAIEATLAELWGELLGASQVGIHDSFFELGGHSLLATRLITQVRELFGVDLPLRALFDEPTVAGMAGVLLEQLANNNGDLAGLLDELEGLSDEFVQQLLDEE